MNSQQSAKPLIGLAMGDAAGIGPELIVKALENRALTQNLDVLVIGDQKIMETAAAGLNSRLVLVACKSVQEARFCPESVPVIDLNNVPVSLYACGKVDARTGKAAVEYTKRAVEMALAGEIDALVSAPVNKQAMHLAGYDFAGVTELLAHLTQAKQVEMILILGPLRLFYLTNHVSMKQVFASIKKESILQKLRNVQAALSGLGIHQGKIAVAAFNPHAGEGGCLGTEEIDEIIPALDTARQEGIRALGPFPADTIFLDGKSGAYDAILVMYHDQGNIAAKLMGFGAGVTFAAGLPVIRTSVAHGTAFDIAGKGVAEPDTLIAAIDTAGQIVRTREGVT